MTKGSGEPIVRLDRATATRLFSLLLPGRGPRASLPGPPASPGGTFLPEMTVVCVPVNSPALSADEVIMFTRRPSPVTTLVIGLLCAVLAGGCWAIAATLNDERAVTNEASAIAKSEPVREAFAWQIAEALAPHSATTASSALNLANDIATRVVESAAFQQAVAAAMPAIYAQIVKGNAADVVLDPALVNQAFVSVGATAPPNLSLVARRGEVPDLRNPLDVMQKLSVIFAALAALLIGLGLLIAPHRGRAVMRIGRWLITTGILTVVIFWALPTLAFLPLGGWIGVAGILLATGDWLAMPASVLAAFGVAILVLGNAGESQARRRELAVIPKPVGRTPIRSSVT